MFIRGFFTNSSGILTSRILGFARDLATASILGANVYTDIFFVAFKLPNLFRRIFGEGAFVQAFLPGFTAARYKGRFAVTVLGRLLGAVLLLSLLVTLFAETVTGIIAMGFSPEIRAAAAPYLAVNFYYLDLIFLVTFLSALLHYRKHFATTAFATALLNVALIVALFLARDLEKTEIVWYLTWGVLAGGALQLAVHLWMAKRLGLCRVLVAGVRKRREVDADTGRFYRSFGPAILGSSTAHLSAFLDTFLASFLAAGSISYLYYANRILQLPLALFAIATSMALFPVIARALKREAEKEALELLEKSFRMLLLFLGAATVGGIILSDEIIWLLFERGEFGREDTLLSAGVLAMYLAGLLPFGLAKIFSLWLFSTHRQKEAAKISALALGYNALFSLALVGPMGVEGLALASSLAGFVLLFYSLRAFGWERFRPMVTLRRVAPVAAVLILEAIVLAGGKFLWESAGYGI